MLPANLVYQGRSPFAIPSIAQSRISAALCTESFQRYGSSSPTLKMPTIGLLAHRGAELLPALPVRPGHRDAASRLMIGDEHRRELADAHHVERAAGAAAHVRDDARVGAHRAHRVVPRAPEREEPILPPEDVRVASRILRIVGARQLEAGRGAEVRPTVHAEALPRAVPPVDEDPVGPVARRDLALHRGHELEVVRAERAGDPHLRRRPVPARRAVGADVDPVGVRLLHVVVRRVRIGARDDDHAELATAGHEIAERIAVAEPLAAMMERHRGRVVRDASAGAQAHGVGLRAAEVVEPERRVELPRIVLDERELRPAHRTVDPRGIRRAAAARGSRECAGAIRGERSPSVTAAPATAVRSRNSRRVRVGHGADPCDCARDDTGAASG